MNIKDPLDLFDWLDAEEVKPPADPNNACFEITVSEHVLLKFEDGTMDDGYAVYDNGKFDRWDVRHMGKKVVQWAYY